MLLELREVPMRSIFCLLALAAFLVPVGANAAGDVRLAAAAVAPAMINVRIRIFSSLLVPIASPRRRSVTSDAAHRVKF